jgi:hypothetical protein
MREGVRRRRAGTRSEPGGVNPNVGNGSEIFLLHQVRFPPPPPFLLIKSYGYGVAFLLEAIWTSALLRIGQ